MEEEEEEESNCSKFWCCLCNIDRMIIIGVTSGVGICTFFTLLICGIIYGVSKSELDTYGKYNVTLRYNQTVQSGVGECVTSNLHPYTCCIISQNTCPTNSYPCEVYNQYKDGMGCLKDGGIGYYTKCVIYECESWMKRWSAQGIYRMYNDQNMFEITASTKFMFDTDSDAKSVKFYNPYGQQYYTYNFGNIIDIVPVGSRVDNVEMKLYTFDRYIKETHSIIKAMDICRYISIIITSLLMICVVVLGFVMNINKKSMCCDKKYKKLKSMSYPTYL